MYPTSGGEGTAPSGPDPTTNQPPFDQRQQQSQQQSTGGLLTGLGQLREDQPPSSQHNQEQMTSFPLLAAFDLFAYPMEISPHSASFFDYGGGGIDTMPDLASPSTTKG